MTVRLKVTLYRLAALVAALVPVAAVIAASHHRGSEMALLSAIGLSPIWLGMFGLALLLEERGRRLRADPGRGAAK